MQGALGRAATGCTVAALALALAGCLVADPEDGFRPDGAPAVPWSVSYLCASGHEIRLPAGGCHGRIEGASRALGEPQVAFHPGDPDTFAIAVSDTRRADGMALDLPSTVARGIAVYVTGDGGASFTRHEIDLHAVGGLPYNPALMGADPAVAFTPDGALHLAGLIITRPAPALNNPVSLEVLLFTMRSTDLGGTWEPAVVVEPGDANDREWISASAEGDVGLAWRDHSPGVSKFLLARGGVSEASETVVLDQCVQVSNVAWIDGVPRVGCQAGTDLQVYTLDGTPGLLGTATDACPSNSARITATVSGALAASCYYGSVALSPDGGSSFTRVFDLFEKASVDDGWNQGIGPNIFAVGSDPYGFVHFILSAFPTQYDQVPTGDGRPVAHVVLDPATGDLVHEVELQPESSGPGPLGYGIADDFYGIDFVGSRGILVWTSSDYSTHFAMLDVPA